MKTPRLSGAFFLPLRLDARGAHSQLEHACSPWERFYSPSMKLRSFSDRDG